jgi:predicted aldo/keto reductase-like oxidoreductase
MRTRWQRRLQRVALWAAGILGFGYFALGPILYSLFIGLDWGAYPGGAAIEKLFRGLGYSGQNAISGVFWLLLGLLTAMALAFFAARGRVRKDTDPARRRVLTGVATGAAAALGAAALANGGAALRSLFGWGRHDTGWGAVNAGIQAEVEKLSPSYPEPWKGARIEAYRTLGRTGWRISDVVVGSGRAKDQKGTDVVRLALERGVNYVDTSPDYSATGSEECVGRALKGMRDKIFVATKWCTPWGHLGAGSTVAEYEGVIEQSLSRLGTDYVDLVHVHSCDEVDRLMDPNLHEAFDRLKQAGKVRFLGFSSHTPNLVDVVETAVASGRFDVMMLAYHHGIWPKLGELIARARREQDMGVVAMKTLKGAKHHGLAGFREHADAYSQAALRWVLSNAEVSAAVISFFEFQQVDEYLRASGGQLRPEDVAVLQRYDQLVAGTYCAPHCGACLGSCPEQLAIDDVLRHRMYFEDYGDQKEAMRLYAKLERNASVCASCSAPCTGVCPSGVPIQERMIGAHDLLRLG